MSSWRLSKVLCATSESEETYALFLVRWLQLFLQLAILNLRIWTLTDAILYVNDINYAYFTRRITETNQLWSNARFFCNLLIHLRFIHSTPEGEHLTGACRCVCVCGGGGGALPKILHTPQQMCSCAPARHTVLSCSHDLISRGHVKTNLKRLKLRFFNLPVTVIS